MQQLISAVSKFSDGSFWLYKSKKCRRPAQFSSHTMVSMQADQ